jgi:hypothetical protein
MVNVCAGYPSDIFEEFLYLLSRSLNEQRTEEKWERRAKRARENKRNKKKQRDLDRNKRTN